MTSLDGLSSKERLGLHAIGALGITVVAAILHIALLRPRQQHVDETTMQKQALQQVIDNGEATLARHARLTQRLDELTEQIRGLRVRIPSESDLNGLFSQLSLLAEEHSMSLMSVQPTQKFIGDLAASQGVHCRLMGTYSDLCRFLKALQEMDSLVWTTGAQIVVDQQGQGRVRGANREATTEKETRLQPIELDLLMIYAPEGSTIGKIKVTSDKDAENQT